jgi:release factor glutamine methyltransferase
MRLLYYIYYNWFYKFVLHYYLRSDRRVRFEEFDLLVKKNVFHPGLFFSTHFFYEFIKDVDLKGMAFLEIGCGSGVLSLLAAKMGAEVTAVDIDPVALENTKINFRNNLPDIDYSLFQSDVFSAISTRKFDIIIANPPYFFKVPEKPGHYAWYCGENGEYFERFFDDLHPHLNEGSKVYIVLAENCDINRISAIAAKNKFRLRLVRKKIIKWEENYIYQID